MSLSVLNRFIIFPRFQCFHYSFDKSIFYNINVGRIFFFANSVGLNDRPELTKRSEFDSYGTNREQPKWLFQAGRAFWGFYHPFRSGVGLTENT